MPEEIIIMLCQVYLKHGPTGVRSNENMALQLKGKIWKLKPIFIMEKNENH